VSFRLTYEPPRAPAAPPAIPEDALYALADAGANAAVELDGYRLPVDGTGLAELHRHVERLLEVLRTREPAPGDDALRSELSGAPPGAVMHSWPFASYMLELPVLVFAIDGPVTSVFTRTRAETPDWPLVALEGRDLADPVQVPTAELEEEAQAFVDRVASDVALLSGPSPP
jgi:hypothetical protein